MENEKAFPVSDTVNENGRYQPLETGMDLRDYFAAKAMQSIILMQKNINCTCVGGKTGVAVNAYDIADRMIQVRNKKSV